MAFNHNSALISSNSKVAMCNPWSNYYQIFREHSGNNSKWKKNVPVARMNEAYNLEVI